MSLNEDIRKTLTDPTPLYFAAGVIDKIREEAPGAFAAVRSTDPKQVQAKVTDRARETQARMNKALGSIDADIKKLREQSQSLALQGLGYAAEYAVKAREAYGDLAERGRGAVQNWRGEDTEAPEITVERQSVPVARPPKQERGSAARNGRRTTGAGGAGSTGSRSGTAKSTTARNTSAKSATPKSSEARGAEAKGATGGATGGASGGASGKGATAKSTASKGGAQKSSAAKKPTGGSAAPKSDS